jgi:hypothetical protein
VYYYIKYNNQQLYGNLNIKRYIKNNYFYLLCIGNYNRNNFLFKELYQFYNIKYLEQIYKVRLKEKNINAITILPKQMSKFILYRTRNKSFKSFKIKYFNEVIYLFLVNIFLKNSKNICKFIKKKLEKVHFKEHRRYFLFFFRIINEYIKSNFRLLKVDGVSLRFKGKLARGGNSRTKRMFFKVGKTSFGDKHICLNSNKWSV